MARVPVRDALPRHPQTVSTAVPEVLDAERDPFRWQKPQRQTQAALLVHIAEVAEPSFASIASQSSILPVAPERDAVLPAAVPAAAASLLLLLRLLPLPQQQRRDLSA